MGGPIGATSGSFILMGAALVLSGRVDDKTVRVAIAPGTWTSAIDPALSDWIKARHGSSDLKIHLRAETFHAQVAAVEAQPSEGAQIRLGQDVLGENPIEIDFAHHALQPLSASEATHFERRSNPITLRREPDGSLSVALAAASGAPVRAVLDLSRATGVAMPGLAAGSPVTVGGVAFANIDLSDGPKPIVGLYAFRHVRVIFDLGHDRIWVHR